MRGCGPSATLHFGQGVWTQSSTLMALLVPSPDSPVGRVLQISLPSFPAHKRVLASPDFPLPFFSRPTTNATSADPSQLHFSTIAPALFACLHSALCYQLARPVRSIDQIINHPIAHPPDKSTLSHGCQTWLLARVLTVRRVTTRRSLPHPQVLTTPSATPQPPLVLPGRPPSPLPMMTSPACPTSHLLMSGLTPPPPSRLTSAPWHPPPALATRRPRSSHPSRSRQTSPSQSF